MIRLITLWSMKWNTRVFCAHVKSEENGRADHLSRGRVTHFRKMVGKKADISPTELPQDLWPFPMQWLNDN